MCLYLQWCLSPGILPPALGNTFLLLGLRKEPCLEPWIQLAKHKCQIKINESMNQNPDCPEPGCKETHSPCSSGRSNSLRRSKTEEEKLFTSQETKSPWPSFKEGKLLDRSLKEPEQKASKGSSRSHVALQKVRSARYEVSSLSWRKRSQTIAPREHPAYRRSMSPSPRRNEIIE